VLKSAKVSTGATRNARRSITLRPVDRSLYDSLHAVEDAHWWFRGRRRVVAALLSLVPPPPRPRILDAGCGTGRNLIDYARMGPASGVDPSPVAIDYCHRLGIETAYEGALEALPLEDGSFDLLFATDVIEHVDDDVTALREMHRVAAPGASLVLTVPAYEWMWGPFDDLHHHKRRYTRARLVEAASAAGWTVVADTYFNSILLPAIATVRLVQKARGGGASGYGANPRALSPLLEDAMGLEARLIAGGRRLPAGVSVGLACRA